MKINIHTHWLVRLRSTVLPLAAALGVAACGGGKDAEVADSAASAPGTSSGPAAPAPSGTNSNATPPAATAEGLRITLTSATGGASVPFTVGQPLRRGDVPRGSVLTASLPGFQCVTKNRWPDGSAKFAVLSGTANLGANAPQGIKLSVAAAPAEQAPISTANLKATGIAASVKFPPFGTAGWTGADWDQPAQTLIAGPQMSSWVYRKPIGQDPHLVAWLEVRAYRSGAVEVLPWLENGYLNVPGPTEKAGTATFSLGGRDRFSEPLKLLNHQRAVLARGTTLTHWLGTDPQVTPRHDTAYAMATRLVPNYRGVTPANSALFKRLHDSYTPLMQGGFPGAMGTAGYSESIGLLPEWEAAFFTTGGDPRAWRSVIINGYAAGRYGIHYRDETTQRPLKFSTYPHLVMGGGSGVSDVGASTKNSYTPAASGAQPPRFATSHHPSMGYAAYLLTGWNYFAEESQFLATANFLKQNDSTRHQGTGVLESITGSNTTRGAAWAIRSLAQAATIAPDDDPLHSELVDSLSANIAYYHGRYIAIPNNPLGLVQPYSDYAAGDPWSSAPWMDDFFTAAFGYAKELAVHSEAVQSKLDEFLAWKYRSVVGRLGGSGDRDFSYRYAAQYTVLYSPSAKADWLTGKGPWYANWGEVARAMNLPTSGNPGEALASGYPTEATGYWGNLMPALSYAVDHGAAGATDAWRRVTSASNFPSQANAYHHDPVWGVQPRSVAAGGGQTPAPSPAPAPASSPASAPSAPPAPAPAPASAPPPGVPIAPSLPPAAPTPGTSAQSPASSPAAPAAIASLTAGQWLELPNTKIRSVLPSVAQQGYPPNIVKAWNGGTVDAHRSRLLVWGGGHADYWGNEMYALDLPSLSIKRIVEPSPRTSEADCTSALPDNTPTSRHTYDGLTYIAHADRFFATHGSKSPCGGDDWATWTYDFKTNRWQQMVFMAGPHSFGSMAVYDQQTRQVFAADQRKFFAYSLENNRYTELGSHSIDYHLSATIDSKRRKFVTLGDGVRIIDLDTGRLTTVTTTNAPAFVSSKQSPGVAYDPVADRIVAWHGGSEVWALDMDTLAWTQVAKTPGPTAAAPKQGTFGRWGYIPQYRVFALINDIDQNAWVFRLAR